MGDRGNIIVKDGESTVYLYTHWSGSNLPESIQASLKRGKDRWTDGQYLARILFDDMVQGDRGLTGYGISSVIGDGGTDIEVNVDAQTVDGVPFAEYVTKNLLEDDED